MTGSQASSGIVNTTGVVKQKVVMLATSARDI